MELLLLLDIEVCPGTRSRKIPELDALMKMKGLHIFHQNLRGLLSKKDYWVELIDSFQKVQLFALTERHVNEGLDYGTLFEIPGFEIVNEPKHNGCCGGEGSEYTYKIT